MSAIERARDKMNLAQKQCSYCGIWKKALEDGEPILREAADRIEKLESECEKKDKRIAELEEEVDALNDEIDGWKGIKKVTAADCIKFIVDQGTIQVDGESVYYVIESDIEELKEKYGV